MIRSPKFKYCLATGLSTVALSIALNRPLFAQAGDQDEPSAGAQQGVEVQTRGPVHEAFAEVISFQPEPGVTVSKPPPGPIEEIPPDQKPEGANVAWIPGYWAWDDDRDDFMWVSGVWRALPPGRQWVPGYWQKEGNQYQWISGYWADAQADSTDYLPQPPETLEEGPSSDPPSANDVWIPGTWVWHSGRYAWRPGYWMPGQANWVWVPAHYVWTPRGYVFVDGYWDYAINRRGLAFAPVFINPQVYGQQGFIFSPLMALNMGLFGSSLFLRPGYGHYYFGDYYAPGYANAGFYPWFNFGSQYAGYDPIYAAARWQNRQNPAWEQNLQTQFEQRRENESARPPRTFAEQQQRTKTGGSAAATMLVAAPVAALAAHHLAGQRMQPVSEKERRQIAGDAKTVHAFGSERQKIESQGAGAAGNKGTTAAAEPKTAKLPKSPIVAQRTEGLPKHEAPPATPQAPKPDPNARARKTEAEPGRAPTAGPRSIPPGRGKAPPPTSAKGAAKPEAGERPPAAEKPAVKPAPRSPTGNPEPKKKAEPPPAPPKPALPQGGAPKGKPEPKPAPKEEPKPAPQAPKPQPKNETPPKPK